ncbi:MAG: hypothetical protein Q8922_09745 [Bacteroidota bacterium]|nr:hypothetical protein [Bacteroidota bacterium]MDP4232837.1 hypothetical protein [Bacteroidota bacterium]MDP4241881.1 hypothetical protein [Bacteroidota bacterium]MDP4288206.1 hypothetical protein [Bacteroidota bacterium]
MRLRSQTQRFWICFILLLASGSLSAQERNPLETAEERARLEASTPVSFLVPDGIREGYLMRAYLRSEEFGRFSASVTPEESFDEIYYTAVCLAHGDISTASLAASFGCLEHEYLPFALFGAELRIPITSETHSEFERRCAHLPQHLYHLAEDDRDKPQHFFASAWLKSWVCMDWLVDLAGEMVEAGENLLLVGGSRDPRDIHANQDGARFEPQAESRPATPPSISLTPNP